MGIPIGNSEKGKSVYIIWEKKLSPYYFDEFFKTKDPVSTVAQHSRLEFAITIVITWPKYLRRLLT